MQGYPEKDERFGPLLGRPGLGQALRGELATDLVQELIGVASGEQKVCLAGRRAFEENPEILLDGSLGLPKSPPVREGKIAAAREAKSGPIQDGEGDRSRIIRIDGPWCVGESELADQPGGFLSGS